jgi:pyrroloquinoline quinone biosynthesis protein B
MRPLLSVSLSLWLSVPLFADEVRVLGIAQDGGVPHIGCTQALCVEARRDPGRRERVAALGLIDDAGKRYLIDATPDIASQIDSLNTGRRDVDRRRPVDGILLTHAHIGHYAGLMFLGREALGADAVPVYATPRMARFLRGNAPWSELVARKHIAIVEITPGEEFALGRLRAVALAVPHRDELSDTVGYRVRGTAGAILYVPDVDKWERWSRRLEDEVAAVDVALVDGTFYEAGELPGRAMAEVPHPFVPETMARLPAALRGRVRFIHLNHTNRLLWDAGARAAAAAAGIVVARDGDVISLSGRPEGAGAHP